MVAPSSRSQAASTGGDEQARREMINSITLQMSNVQDQIERIVRPIVPPARAASSQAASTVVELDHGARGGEEQARREMINSITLQMSIVQDQIERIVRRRIMSAEGQVAPQAAIHAPEVPGSDEEEGEEEDEEEDQEEDEEEDQEEDEEEDEDGMWRRHEEASSEPEPEPSPTPRGVGSSCV